MTTRTFTLGPDSAALTLHTGRQGVAAKIGHDLVLGVGAWSATVVLDGDSLTSVSLHAETSSLTVLEGHGGAKPLSEKDKAKIESEASATLKGATVDFGTTTPTGLGGTLAGTVTLNGVTKPFSLPFEVHVADGSAEVRANGELVQSEFGIKPYSAMLGALKLRDMVEIRLQAVVPV